MKINKYLVVILISISISIIVANEIKNEVSTVKNDMSIGDLLIKFCSGKSDNFCSKENLQYMFKVLKMEQIVRKFEELVKHKLEIVVAKSKQQKLNKLFEKHPKYKFIGELIPSRFY